ncbi:Hypothetical protein CINCED_3A014414 [Cinara cedri]|uniref:Uncharacterized protein n=1 Tax=Cinara cedri TaxID=506608 RepID=A0A5E4MX59_9HEMI|nr:Hypothetical protein CINCED_3A014414 [Cinara cedri]
MPSISIHSNNKTINNLKTSWFMRLEQLHNDMCLPYLSTWIMQQFKNCHEKLSKAEGAYSSRKMAKDKPQHDILLEAQEDHSDSGPDLEFIN